MLMCHTALKAISSVCSRESRLFFFPFHAFSSYLLAEFKSLQEKPSTYQWNSIVKAHVDSGRFETALSLFAAMRRSGAQPDHYTFPLVNRAISLNHNLVDFAEAVHCLATKLGFAGDVYFCNTMMEAYARNGGVSLARQLFDEMRVRDVVSWTSLFSAYVQMGDHHLETFEFFKQMRAEGLEPSPVTLAVLLRACCIAEDMAGGFQLYGFSIKIGFGTHELVQNSVLTMLSKLACLEEVEQLFGGIQNRSATSWNILISAYSSTGDASRAAECYGKMKLELTPTHETLTLLISAFAKCEDLHQGRKVHCDAMKTGHIDAVLRAALVDFYAKCGELESAILLFEEAQVKDCAVWSIMMWGFIQNGESLQTVSLFQGMQNAGFKPTKDVLRALVHAYSDLGALVLGRGVHGYLIRNTIEAYSDDALLETSILNMYAKCGSIVLARRCFDQIVQKDVVAWTSMIEAYAIHGLGLEALELFYQMQEEGIRPNKVTFLSLLSACSHSGLLSEGCELFNCMTNEFGINPDLSHYTCLVDLLGRSGKLLEALDVIENMSSVPDGRIWGALLASCRTHSDGVLGNYVAKKLFDLEPDNVGYRVILSNIFASDEMWEETEKSRKSGGKKELRKKPGWSSVQVKGVSTMFVAGDRSHPQVGKIYELLEYIARHIEL
ncbi:hypothetical protein Cni_G28555 [Canna indica]|uniref:Pentatricopeptide repeat-containing protein n=1 Tax=Canna indica TaxID=4628 RepID=A0AAQ3QSH8_9LILI|nr:hypothetical protein Cni_G28555 [Canna indica]